MFFGFINSFTQCILLLFAAIHLSVEATKKLIVISTINEEFIVPVALVSLVISIVNLWGVHGLTNIFHKKHSSKKELRAIQMESQSNMNNIENGNQEHFPKNDDSCIFVLNQCNCDHQNNFILKVEDKEEISPTEAINIDIKDIDCCAREENLKALTLHLIFDLVSALMVVFSCVIVRFFKVFIIDFLVSIVCSILLIKSTIPILVQTISKLKTKSYDFSLLFNDVNDFTKIRTIEFRNGKDNILCFDTDTINCSKLKIDKQLFLSSYNLSKIVLI